METPEQISEKLQAIKAAKERTGRREYTFKEEKEIERLLGKYYDSSIEQTASLPRPEILHGVGSPNLSAGKSSGPFQNLGDQLMAVRNAGTPGAEADKRLYEVRAATGLSEAVGADGGFLLQQDFSNQILQDSFQTGKLSRLCNTLTISANSNSVLVPALDETSRASTRFGGSLGYWTDEAAQKTASKPKIRQLQMTLNKMVVLVYSTDELLMDSSLAEKVIRQTAADEIGFQLDDAIINGTGAGRPLGILNSGSLVTVDKESGQAAATLLTENVTKMYSRAINPQQSVWLMHHSVLPALFTMSLAVGTGGSAVWLTNLADSPQLRLLGLPVLICEQCQQLGTVGDIILADFSNGYIWASKGGVQADMSIHVRFVYDESVFRFVVRCDGQPVRASALTPYKGGSSWTQSHFVALQTRS